MKDRVLHESGIPRIETREELDWGSMQTVRGVSHQPLNLGPFHVGVPDTGSMASLIRAPPDRTS